MGGLVGILMVCMWLEVYFLSCVSAYSDACLLPGVLFLTLGQSPRLAGYDVDGTFPSHYIWERFKKGYICPDELDIGGFPQTYMGCFFFFCHLSLLPT
jgi:hypothetical protein